MTTKSIATTVSAGVAEKFRALVKSNNLTNSKVFSNYIEEMLEDCMEITDHICTIGYVFSNLNDRYAHLIEEDLMYQGFNVSCISGTVDADMFNTFFMSKLTASLSIIGYSGSFSIRHILRLFIFKFLDEYKLDTLSVEVPPGTVYENPYDVCISRLSVFN